jgi:hypothetical protein
MPGRTQNSGDLLAITGMALEGREFRDNARQVTLNVGEIQVVSQMPKY